MEGLTRPQIWVCPRNTPLQMTHPLTWKHHQKHVRCKCKRPPCFPWVSVSAFLNQYNTTLYAIWNTPAVPTAMNTKHQSALQSHISTKNRQMTPGQKQMPNLTLDLVPQQQAPCVGPRPTASALRPLPAASGLDLGRDLWHQVLWKSTRGHRYVVS
jgi:hypothetical protein